MRRGVLFATVAVLTTLAVVGGWWYARRNTTTPVSPEQAVEQFQRGTTSSSAATPVTTAAAPTNTPLARLPDPGVYVYDTTGSDSVDALGGASHRYPATTTITVEPGGCGVTQRWQALEERWDAWTSCVEPDGFRLGSFTGYHRFFGQGTTDEWSCSGEARPVRATPGTTWRTTCLEAGAPTVWQGTVVGDETIVVGADPVRVQHVRLDLDDGLPGDVQRYEAWYLDGTDLLVRQVADMATANTSTVGTVHYREEYTIQLVSLTPRR